jgi:hypothetical protein
MATKKKGATKKAKDTKKSGGEKKPFFDKYLEGQKPALEDLEGGEDVKGGMMSRGFVTLKYPSDNDE